MIDPDTLDALGDLDYEQPARSEASPPLAFDLRCEGPCDVRLTITEVRPRKPRTKEYHLFRSQWDEDAYLVREVEQETIYTVHPHTPHCECRGFENVRNCRHVAALLDLEGRGELWLVPSTDSQSNLPPRRK